jgi:AcrR family transcriptional regulator
MARKRGFTRDDVVAAAAEIADRDGLTAATPSAVATRLGIATPSLYSHVDGAAGLRRQLALRGAAAMTEAFAHAVETTRGVDRIHALAHAYRTFVRRHPGLYQALLPAPRPGEDDELYAAMAAPVAIVVDVLHEVGAPPDQAIHLVRALRALLHGFVSLELANGFGMPVDLDTSFDTAVALLAAGIVGRRTAEVAEGS